MEKIVSILLLTGLIALMCCSGVSGRRPGKKDFCQLSPEGGRCRAYLLRWYYESSSGECKSFTYGGCRGNNNRFDTKAICERVCKPGCRYESCNTTCSNGFILDETGCNTCLCQPEPEQVYCPAIECPTSCPNGYSTDSVGCMTCECRTEPVQTRVIRDSPPHQCPPVCYMFCQFGNKKDDYGCDICACKTKEEVCGSQQCMLECPTGLAKDDRGCELCECNPAAEEKPSCPSNQCLKECSHGFKKDSFGCDVCMCATRRDRSRQAADCSDRPTCTMRCQYGFLKGPDGCDMCRCVGHHADRRRGKFEGRFGRRNSAENDCGVRPMCAMFCPNGFQKDNKGCDICVCRPDSSVRAVQLPANIGNSASQLPANTPAQLPAQIPSNIPAQQPAQIPANIPAQLPAETQAQNPAEVPEQLPAETECTPKRCHKRMRCAFGFAKDEDGCDTCICSPSRSRTASKRQS